MAKANRPAIGLRGMKFAVLTGSSDVAGGTPAYGALTDISGVAEMSFDPASSMASLFADDGLILAADTLGEMKISLTLTDVDPANLATILGHTYANGQLVQKATDQSPYIALMAKRARAGTDGGNAVDEYVVLYKCKLGKPQMQGKTKGSSLEFGTVQLSGIVCKLTANDTYLMRMRTDDPAANATTLANFFNQVTLPSADLNAFTFTSATASISGKTFTLAFAKAGGGQTVVMDASALNIQIAVASTAGVIPLTAFAPGGASATPNLVVTTTATLTAVPYIVSVSPTLHDGNNVACVGKMALVTPA